MLMEEHHNMDSEVMCPSVHEASREKYDMDNTTRRGVRGTVEINCFGVNVQLARNS